MLLTEVDVVACHWLADNYSKLNVSRMLNSTIQCDAVQSVESVLVLTTIWNALLHEHMKLC